MTLLHFQRRWLQDVQNLDNQLNLLNEFSRVRRLSTYRILIDSCRFHKGVWLDSIDTL